MTAVMNQGRERKSSCGGKDLPPRPMGQDMDVQTAGRGVQVMQAYAGATELRAAPNTSVYGERPLVETRNRWYGPLKRSLDFLAAGVLLVILSPLMVLTAVLVRLSSPGPILYRQRRSGKNGRPFAIIKFRTMVQNAEAGTGPVWSQAGDTRITKIGKFLRETHLDEFPQLFNILAGHMSLIGPRPERPEIVAHLEETIPHYADRMDVLPGVTGFAQVKLPPDSNLDSVRLKLAYDLYYVQHVGPWLDLQIVLATALQFAGSVISQATVMLGLPKHETVARFIPHLLDEQAAKATFRTPAEATIVSPLAVAADGAKLPPSVA